MAKLAWRLAERLYQQLADTGHGDEGTQALWELYASGEPTPPAA